MKKLLDKIFNHEIWCTCKKCSKHFDKRIDGHECPNCGTTN